MRALPKVLAGGASCGVPCVAATCQLYASCHSQLGVSVPSGVIGFTPTILVQIGQLDEKLGELEAERAELQVCVLCGATLLLCCWVAQSLAAMLCGSVHAWGRRQFAPCIAS